MEVLRIPAPCVCAPDGQQHPVELALRTEPRVCIVSMRTPCDRAEADAVDRLGGVTCLGMFADVRALLRTSNVQGNDVLVAQVVATARGEEPLDVSTAARAAAHVRRERARLRSADTTFWPPGHVRLAPTELLFEARLRRCWPGTKPKDFNVNLRTTEPHVQISWGLLERQPVYQYDADEDRWELTGDRYGDNNATAGHVRMYGGAAATLNELLPAAVMRGVVRVRKGTRR